MPEYKFQIEIKDNHIWHRKQVENGKWKMKENAAEKYCSENNMSYKILFPNEIDLFFDNLLNR